jgi:hypothetical protein
MLAFFVSLVPIALKALAGSFGSAVGSNLGNAFAGSFTAAGKPELPLKLASQPTPADEMQAQKVIVSSMNNDPQLRQTVETTLEQAKPGTIAKAQETAKVLERDDPQLVQKIANGEVHYSEFEKAMAKQANWSAEQAQYYATDDCPIGGEDVSLFGVKYHDANGKEVGMFETMKIWLAPHLGGPALPITARCEKGHEWRVDKPSA